MAYVGSNGGGKSLAAVRDTLPSLLAGRRVLSTVRLLDFENPRPCDDASCSSPDHARHMAAHPLWIPWTTWKQLLDVEHCDVLADEVTGVASSRESHSMPSAVANTLVQLRRRDVVLRWTAPSWPRADKIIRECTQAVTLCRGFLPVRVATGEGENERAWRHRRLFRWHTYDALEMDEFTEGKRDKVRPTTRDHFWGPGCVEFSAYDTFDAVLSIGSVSESGRCLVCDGRRSAPACTCPDYTSRKARPEAAGSPRSGEAAPGGPPVVSLPAVSLRGSRFAAGPR